MGNLFHIDHAVYMIWISAALTLLVLVVGAQLAAHGAVAEGRFANLVEAMVEFVRENIVDEFLGHNGKQWFGFIAAIFFFILFANLLGKLPMPPVFAHHLRPAQAEMESAQPGEVARVGFESPTGNINVTACLAVLVFVVSQGVGLVKLGPLGYFKKKFILPAAPLPIQIVAIPIMFLVLLAEPFSLAVRLFANMTAGHIVILTFATAPLVGGLWLFDHSLLVKPAALLPFLLTVVLLAFELFVAFIQAFIFALLSALYLSESLEEHH